MTYDDHKAFKALWDDVMQWLPPTPESADPSADWVCLEGGYVMDWREKRDPELVARFAALLEQERIGLARNLRASMGMGDAVPASKLALVPVVGSDSQAGCN